MKARGCRRDRGRMHFHRELSRLIESPKLQTGSYPSEKEGDTGSGILLVLFIFVMFREDEMIGGCKEYVSVIKKGEFGCFFISLYFFIAFSLFFTPHFSPPLPS